MMWEGCIWEGDENVKIEEGTCPVHVGREKGSKEGGEAIWVVATAAAAADVRSTVRVRESSAT